LTAGWKRLGGGAGLALSKVGLISEEMGVAGLARAGLAGEDGGEWAGWGFASYFGGGRAIGKALESRLDRCQVVEGVEAVGAATELAGSLGAAEHQETEDGGFVSAEIEDGADAVLVFGDAGVSDRGDEGEILEGVQGLTYLVFGEIEDWVAAGALVAGVDERVEREGIVFGRCDLFFDEGAENAELDGVEMHTYKGATAIWRG
jgi:hypothetical protein